MVSSGHLVPFVQRLPTAGMDADDTRARVFAQWGDNEEDLHWAKASCPVESNQQVVSAVIPKKWQIKAPCTCKSSYQGLYFLGLPPRTPSVGASDCGAHV